MRLHRVVSNFFCVGVVTNDEDFVVEAPPIVGYAKGWRFGRFVQYANKRGWTVREIE